MEATYAGFRSRSSGSSYATSTTSYATATTGSGVGSGVGAGAGSRTGSRTGGFAAGIRFSNPRTAACRSPGARTAPARARNRRSTRRGRRHDFEQPARNRVAQRARHLAGAGRQHGLEKECRLEHRRRHIAVGGDRLTVVLKTDAGDGGRTGRTRSVGRGSASHQLLDIATASCACTTTPRSSKSPSDAAIG